MTDSDPRAHRNTVTFVPLGQEEIDGAAVDMRYLIPGRYFLHHPDVLPFLCERKKCP